MAAPVLSRDGVTLDALQPEDASRLVDLEDAELRRWYGRMAPMTLDGAERLVSRAQAAWDGRTTDRFMWAIRETGLADLIGVVEIWQTPGSSAYYIGIWLGPQYRRKGLAIRAMRLAIDYAFDVFRWRWIEAQIEPGNVGSVALALSLGFEVSGIGWRTGDHAEINVYRLRRGEWRTRSDAP